MNLCYVFFSLAVAAESSQQLVYDLSIRGKLVGRRDVKITYIPASESKPLGSRRLESYTEIDHVIAGKSIKYRQRATAHLGRDTSSVGVRFGPLRDRRGLAADSVQRDGAFRRLARLPRLRWLRGGAREPRGAVSEADGAADGRLRARHLADRHLLARPDRAHDR